MSNFKNVYFFVVGLSFFSILVFVYKQTENEIGENYYLYSRSNSEAEMEARLDTEDRRCEAKVHKNPVSLQLTHRQYSRKKLLYEQCNDYNNLNITGKWTTFDDIPHEELNNLLVDDRHGIIYCYVPKVACTAWKRIMIFLSESLKVYGVPYKNAADIPIEHVHNQSSLQHLKAYPKEVMKQKLETYQKFIFVRDPFVRLISAYRDKLEKDNQVYYENIGKYILNKFGKVSDLPESVKEAHAQRIVPSFSNFVEYILSLPAGNSKLLDEHWRQTIHLCHPCLINYDFIGRMETVDEDAAHLLRILKVDNIVNFKPWIRNKTELSEIKKWFSNIPIEWRKKLYNIYKADFQLFGYKNHDNLEIHNLEKII